MDELVVLANEQGEPIGTAKKSQVHSAHTPLHLAFSCYIFNPRGKFLLTQRALTKKVWPGWWTNSVCGHLLPGETTEQAIHRRAEFELGLNNLEALQVILPEYRYRTPPYHGIIENEICPVYVAVVEAQPKPNPQEVEAYEWTDWEKMLKLIAAEPDKYSWWFKNQLALLKPNADFRNFIKSFR